jgi:predicted dehydrogenase
MKLGRYSGKRRKRREHERGYHFCMFTDVFMSQGPLLRTQGTRRRRRRRRSDRRSWRRWWNEAVRAGVPKKTVHRHEPARTVADREERRASAAVASRRRPNARKSGLQVRAPAREHARDHVSAHLDRIVSGCSRRSSMSGINLRRRVRRRAGGAGWWWRGGGGGEGPINAC